MRRTGDSDAADVAAVLQLQEGFEGVVSRRWLPAGSDRDPPRANALQLTHAPPACAQCMRSTSNMHWRCSINEEYHSSRRDIVATDVYIASTDVVPLARGIDQDRLGTGSTCQSSPGAGA